MKCTFPGKIIRAGAIVPVLLLCSVVIAQTPGIGTWNILNGKINLDENWSLFAEGQIRSQKFYNHLNYHEYKGGINYNITDKAAALIGMGHYVTYDPTGNFKSPVSNSEFRLWEQFTLTNNLNRVKLEHRYRIEQRFTSSGFRNRFRYRINAVIPINKSTVEPGTFYANISEEIFLTNKEPYFERSRLFAGAGFSISKTLTLQGGWLKQFDFRSDRTSFTKDYMQISFLLDFKSDNSKRERHPSSID